MEICGVIGPHQLIIILTVLIFAFIFLGLTLIALVDILRNEFTGNNKIIWVLVLLFLEPINAILYYIIRYHQKIKK